MFLCERALHNVSGDAEVAKKRSIVFDGLCRLFACERAAWVIERMRLKPRQPPAPPALRLSSSLANKRRLSPSTACRAVVLAGTGCDKIQRTIPGRVGAESRVQAPVAAFVLPVEADSTESDLDDDGRSRSMTLSSMPEESDSNEIVPVDYADQLGLVPVPADVCSGIGLQLQHHWVFWQRQGVLSNIDTTAFEKFTGTESIPFGCKCPYCMCWRRDAIYFQPGYLQSKAAADRLQARREREEPVPLKPHVKFSEVVSFKPRIIVINKKTVFEEESRVTSLNTDPSTLCVAVDLAVHSVVAIDVSMSEKQLSITGGLEDEQQFEKEMSAVISKYGGQAIPRPYFKDGQKTSMTTILDTFLKFCDSIHRTPAQIFNYVLHEYEGCCCHLRFQERSSFRLSRGGRAVQEVLQDKREAAKVKAKAEEMAKLDELVYLLKNEHRLHRITAHLPAKLRNEIYDKQWSIESLPASPVKEGIMEEFYCWATEQAAIYAAQLKAQRVSPSQPTNFTSAQLQELHRSAQQQELFRLGGTELQPLRGKGSQGN